MASQNDHQIFERPDWSLNPGGHPAAPQALLSRLVLKEIADNALDTGAKVTLLPVPGRGGYVAEDDGTGIDGGPEDIAGTFSIGRPMRSSKLLRLPPRGAQGKGVSHVQ